MNLKILTPEKIIFEGDVDSVTLPGKMGQFTVLTGHDLLLAELSGGSLYYKYTDAEGKSHRIDYDVGEGCAEILKNNANVFVSGIEKIVTPHEFEVEFDAKNPLSLEGRG